MRKIARDEDIQLVMRVLIGCGGPLCESWDYNEWIYFCFHFRLLKMHHRRPLPLPWDHCQSNTFLRYHWICIDLKARIWCWVTALDAVVSDILIWPPRCHPWSAHWLFMRIIISSSSVLPGWAWAVPADGVSSVHTALWRPGGTTARLPARFWFSCFRGGSREEDERADTRMR